MKCISLYKWSAKKYNIITPGKEDANYSTNTNTNKLPEQEFKMLQ